MLVLRHIVAKLRKVGQVLEEFIVIVVALSLTRLVLLLYLRVLIGSGSTGARPITQLNHHAIEGGRLVVQVYGEARVLIGLHGHGKAVVAISHTGCRRCRAKVTCHIRRLSA